MRPGALVNILSVVKALYSSSKVFYSNFCNFTFLTFELFELPLHKYNSLFDLRIQIIKILIRNSTRKIKGSVSRSTCKKHEKIKMSKINLGNIQKMDQYQEFLVVAKKRKSKLKKMTHHVIRTHVTRFSARQIF